jgi:hypothetical protein
MGSALIEKTAGIQMLHIPYGGVAAAVTALLGDSVHVVLAAPSSVKQQIDAEKMRAIASTGKERHPLFADVPTLSEAGLTNLSVLVWYGMLAPAGTPESVLAQLRNGIAEMLKDPKVVQRLRALGYEPSCGGCRFPGLRGQGSRAVARRRQERRHFRRLSDRAQTACRRKHRDSPIIRCHSVGYALHARLADSRPRARLSSAVRTPGRAVSAGCRQ